MYMFRSTIRAYYPEAVRNALTCSDLEDQSAPVVKTRQMHRGSLLVRTTRATLPRISQPRRCCVAWDQLEPQIFQGEQIVLVHRRGRESVWQACEKYSQELPW